MALERARDVMGRPMPWVVLFALWTCFIWGHSLVSGPDSAAESSRFVELVMPLLARLWPLGEDAATFAVRKCAHFLEYAVLGMIALGLGARLGRSDRLAAPVLALVLVTAAIPVADETIQLFVPGRAGSPYDVCIDLAGVTSGALLARTMRRRHQKRQRMLHNRQ